MFVLDICGMDHQQPEWQNDSEGIMPDQRLIVFMIHGEPVTTLRGLDYYLHQRTEYFQLRSSGGPPFRTQMDLSNGFGSQLDDS